MLRYKSQLIIAFILMPLALAGAACFNNESNNRWANAQRESTQGGKTATTPATQSEVTPNNPARSSKPLPGGSFNKFFPESSDGFTTTASQEKEGFAEYKLKKDGKDMAMLAISDTAANPEAATKFKESTRQIGGYPAIEQGTTATAVLVDNRFQVKVLSRNPAFTKNDREAWLQKFNLRGLAGL
jgi:hypothetical protein